MTKFPSCNGERSWWLLSNDKCLRSATARTLWKKGESSAPSVFHAFLGAICERALNLYVCRGGALWLAYHRTQTQSATQWECLFNPSTDIDSYYSYDTRTRQKCFIRTGYSFQPVSGSTLTHYPHAYMELFKNGRQSLDTFSWHEFIFLSYKVTVFFFKNTWINLLYSYGLPLPGLYELFYASN